MVKLLHRGNNNYHPENTIQALESSLNLDFVSGFETDIMLTKDNIWILFHDKNLERLTGINKLVKDTNYRDLPLINIKNKPYKINKLDELVNLNYKNKLFDIEIKADFNINEKSKNDLKKILKRIKSKIILSSFDYRWHLWSKKNNFKFAYLIDDEKYIKKLDLKNFDIVIFDYNLYKKFNNEINKLNYESIGMFNLNKKYIKNFKIEIWDYNDLV
jgi:glycerophosphoryl diester phosphodiesterase